MKNYIAAIDLGTTKTVALIGEKTDSEQYRILAGCELNSTGIIRGEVKNPKDVTELIKKSVDQLKKESGLEFSEIYAGIDGQHIRCMYETVSEQRDNELMTIEQNEIDALQQKIYSIKLDSNEEILNIIPQNYSIDDTAETKPVGTLGKELTGNYHIVIGKTIAINIIKQCMKDNNLKLSGLSFKPVASAAAVLNDDEKEEGVAVVDIGGGTTDLIIYHDNIIRHMAVIPFGGNIITEDIKEGCGTTKRNAESLKIEHDLCFGCTSSNSNNTDVSINERKKISRKDLSKIINARINEILGAIMFEIDESGFADKLNAGIVFTGGGSMLKNFTKFTEFKTGIISRIGKPVCLNSDSIQKFAHPQYSTAVGLIIEGIAHKNSIQKEQVQKKVKDPLQKPVPPQIPVEHKKHGIIDYDKKIPSIWNLFDNNDEV
jgi:cell division protein FtsA